MTNPYESPQDHSPVPEAAWSLLVSSAIAQIALGLAIAATVERVLSPSVGVALACIFLLIAIVTAIAGLPGRPLRFWALRLPVHNVLTAHMLAAHDARYRRALENARLGKRLYHQGIVFDLSPAERSRGRFTAATAIADRNDGLAWRAAAHVEQVAAMLRDESPEFAELTAGRKLVVRFFTSYDAVEEVMGEIDEGQLKWSGRE